MGKLTLHVNDELIASAKKEAAERGTSVSRLVGAFFRSLAARRSESSVPSDSRKPTSPSSDGLPPLTKSLLGSLSGYSENPDAVREKYTDYLENKHS